MISEFVSMLYDHCSLSLIIRGRFAVMEEGNWGWLLVQRLIITDKMAWGCVAPRREASNVSVVVSKPVKCLRFPPWWFPDSNHYIPRLENIYFRWSFPDTFIATVRMSLGNKAAFYGCQEVHEERTKIAECLKTYEWNLRLWVEVFDNRNKKTRDEFISYSLRVKYGS